MVHGMSPSIEILPSAAQQLLSLPLGIDFSSVECHLMYAHGANVAQARARVFAQFGAQVLQRPGPRQWPIHAHAYLEDAPEWLVSLSHTRQDAVLVASSAPGLHGWGVDIESAGRVLHRNPAQRVAHPEDAPTWAAQPLAHWTLKEAAFKAVDSTRALRDPERQSPLLSDLVIGEQQWHWSVDSRYRGACAVSQLRGSHSILWCAFATVWA
jgi:4'-phosphopantetheinyl transferase EntD